MNPQLFIGVIFFVVVLLMCGAAFSYIELERTRRKASATPSNSSDPMPES